MIKEKHDLTCVLCLQFYTKKERCPRKLLCGHTLCTACLAHLIKTQSRKCPTCARKFLASSETQLPTDFTVYKKLSNTNNEIVKVRLAPFKNTIGTPSLNSISSGEQESNEIATPVTPQKSPGYSEAEFVQADLKFNSNLVSPKPFKHHLPLISKISNINRSFESPNDFRTMDVVDIPRQVMPANTIAQDDIQSIPPPSAVMRPLTPPNMPATPFIPTFKPQETQQLSKNKTVQYLPAKAKTLPILHEMPETSAVTSTPVTKLRSIQQIRMDLQDNKYGFPQNIPKPLKRSSLTSKSLVESNNTKSQPFNKSSVSDILPSEPSFDNKSREISLEQNYDGTDETDHAIRAMAAKSRDPSDRVMQPHNGSSMKFNPNSNSIRVVSNSPDNRVTEIKPGMSTNEENTNESSHLNQGNGKSEKRRDYKIVSRESPESLQKTDTDHKINKRILKRQAPIPEENRINRLQYSSPSIKDEEKPLNMPTGSNKIYLKGSSKRKAPSPFPDTSSTPAIKPSENTRKVQSFVTPEGVIKSATKQNAQIPESLELKDEKELPLNIESSLESQVTKYSSNLRDVKHLDQDNVNKTQTKYEQRPPTPPSPSNIPDECDERPMTLNDIELASVANNSCTDVYQNESSIQPVNDTRIESDINSVEEHNNFTNESEEKLENRTGIEKICEKGSHKNLYHSVLSKDNSESTKPISLTSSLQESIKSTPLIESPRPLYIAKIYSGELQIGSVSSKEEGPYEGPQNEPNVNMNDDFIGKHPKRENSVHNDWIKKLIKSTASDMKGQLLHSRDENPSGMFEKSAMSQSEEEIFMNIEISDAKSTKNSDHIQKANTDSKENPPQLQNFKSKGKYKSPYLVERGSLSLKNQRSSVATSKDNAIPTLIFENHSMKKEDNRNETTEYSTLTYSKEPVLQKRMTNSHSKPSNEEYKVSKEKAKRDKIKIPRGNSNSNTSTEGSPANVEEHSQHVTKKHANVFLSKVIQKEHTDLSSDESLPDIKDENESFNNIKENKTHNTRRSKETQGKSQSNSTHKYSYGNESCIPLIKYQQMPVTYHFKSDGNENEEEVTNKETVAKHIYHNESCIPLIRYEPIKKDDNPKKGSLNNYPTNNKQQCEKTERYSNRNWDKKHETDSQKNISYRQHKGSLSSYYKDENNSVSEYSEDISITNHTGETESSEDATGSENEGLKIYERKRAMAEGNVKFRSKDKAETQTSKIMKSFNYKNDIKGFKSHRTRSQVGKAKTKSRNNSDDSYKNDIITKHHTEDTVSRKCHMPAQDTDGYTSLDSDSIIHSDSEVSSNKYCAHGNRNCSSKSNTEFHENLKKDPKIGNKGTRGTIAKSSRSRERKDSGSSGSSYSCVQRHKTMSTVAKSVECGESESSNIDIKLEKARRRVKDAMTREGDREDPKSTMKDKTSKKHKNRKAKYRQYSSEDSTASSVPKIKRGMSDVKRLRKHDQRMVDFSMIPYNYDERLPMRFYTKKKNSSSTKYRNQSSSEEVKSGKLLNKRKGTNKKSMYSFSDDDSNSTSTSTLKLTTLAINDDLDHLMPKSRRDTIDSESQYPKLSSYRSLDDIKYTSEDFPDDIYEAFPSHTENRKPRKMSSSTFSSRTGRWDESDHDQTDGFLLRRPLTLTDSQFTPSFNYRPSSQLHSANFSLINPESDKPDEMVLSKHKSAPHTPKTNEIIKAGIGQCKTHGALLDLYCKTCEEWICNECLDLVHRPPPAGSCVSIPADEAVDHIKTSHTEFFDTKVATLDHFKSDLEKLLESCDKGLKEHETSVAQLSSRVLSEEMIIQGIENMKALVTQKWKQIDQWEDVLAANARRIGQSSSSQEMEEAVQKNSSAILVNVMKGAASEDVPKAGASNSNIW